MNGEEFQRSRGQRLKGKMEKVQGFEDLHVYRRAGELTNRIYELTRGGTFSRDRGLVDQIRRASVSIMSNIAEGFERGTNPEFIQFLFIAKGSCGEVRAQVAIAHDQKYINHADYSQLIDLCRRVSGMIGNLIGYLKKSPYRGARHKKPRPTSMVEEMNKLLKELKR